MKNRFSDFARRFARSRAFSLLPLLPMAFLFSVSLGAQQGFSSLEEQMTGEEFSAAGLDKLSQDELDALNAWIRSRSLATLAAPPKTAAASGEDDDARGFEIRKMEEMDRSPIVSRIKGAFDGWDGQTVFELENGMIWAQADKEKFYTRELENPAVTIKPGMFRTWRLSVEGFNSTCRVERIQ